MVTMVTVVTATHRSVLPPLLNDGMEEGECVDQRLEGHVRTILEYLRRDLEVSVTKI